MQLRNFVKSFDIFGINVGLHFGHWQTKDKGREISYKTEIGGLVSIIYLSCFWIAFFIYCEQMFQYGKNSLSYEDKIPDWPTLGN